MIEMLDVSTPEDLFRLYLCEATDYENNYQLDI